MLFSRKILNFILLVTTILSFGCVNQIRMELKNKGVASSTKLSFASVFDIGTGSNSQIQSLQIDSSGKIIIGGTFVSFNGTSLNRIARLNQDGSIDTTFNIGAGLDGQVHDLKIQSDGKILVGGAFSTYDGQNVGNLIRINSNGSLDSSFDTSGFFDQDVQKIRVQSDGKIMVVGSFNKSIMRLNAEGTVDTSFIVGVGFDMHIYDLAILSDGKMIVVGYFTTYQGNSASRIIKLNADGSIDNTSLITTGASSTVYAIEPDRNGKYIIAGGFSSYNGTTAVGIARINEDCSLDTSFNTGSGFDSLSFAVSVQPNGKILVGGWSTDFNGHTINLITRLNDDGTFDSTFNNGGTSFDWGVVMSIISPSDDFLFLGGQFNTYNGTSSPSLIRLNSSGLKN